jgi:transmembrane sensor
MTDNRLLLLLSKFQDNSCSKEELQELEQWYEKLNTGNQLFIDSLAEEISTEMLAQFRGRLHKRSLVVPFHRKAFFRIAAASVVFVLGILAYLTIYNTETQDDLAEINSNQQLDIASPKISKATITLANGQTILLDSIGNGILLKQGEVYVKKSVDGQIVYTGTSTLPVYNTLSNPRGSKVISLALNDGTRVWLNSESSLRYPVAFFGNQRHVEITGEAYFEVAKDVSKKFIVSSNGVSTEVLGTHFNINAFENERNVKITLLEGSVKVRKDLETDILKPGQQAEVTSGIKVTSNVDMDAVMSWKNGFFHFANTSIPELMEQISRWYDIDIVFKNGIPQRQFGGEISREASLSEVLNILNRSRVQCRLEGRTLIIE